MAARHSSAPLGEPGRLTSRARPRVPAIPRERGAIGLERRIASAKPGAGRSTHLGRPLGCKVPGAEPGATGSHDEARKRRRHPGKVRRHRGNAIDRLSLLDDLEPRFH